MNSMDLSRRLDTELAHQGRGAARRFAQHLDVSPTSVSRWTLGKSEPGMDRWPEIEEYFGWKPGTIRKLLVPARPRPVFVPDPDDDPSPPAASTPAPVVAAEDAHPEIVWLAAHSGEMSEESRQILTGMIEKLREADGLD